MDIAATLEYRQDEIMMYANLTEAISLTDVCEDDGLYADLQPQTSTHRSSTTIKHNPVRSHTECMFELLLTTLIC